MDTVRSRLTLQRFDLLSRSSRVSRQAAGEGRSPGVAQKVPLLMSLISSRIRILHSVGHLERGGIETWLYQMVQRLDPARFDHHVLVWTEKDEPFTQQFREAGARVIPILNRSNPVYLVANLRKIVREHGPYDVLHTHGTHFQGLVMAAGGLVGLRTRLAHSHNDLRPVLRRSSVAYRAYAAAGYGAMRRLSAAGLGVSETAAECAFGPDWRKDPRWRLLYCGVDFEPLFRPADPALRARLGIPVGKKVIGHVGRYVPQKNHKLIVEMAAELARRGAAMHFLLIGDGPLRSAITQEIAERKLTEHFTFVPDTSEIPPYYVSAMDGFVFPSVHEGVGLAAVEAQAAGLPLVVSDTVPAEVIVNMANAQRVPLGASPAAWADALERMPSRDSTADAAFQKMFRESRFNIEQCAVKLAEHYEALVKG